MFAGAINKYSLAATFTLVFIAGCEQAAEKLVPVPQLIENKYEENIFSPDQVHLTIRNTGVGGKLLIKVYQKDAANYREWTESAYFSAGEQRKIDISVKGMDSGKYSVQIRPE